MHILVIRLSALGDVAMAIPAVYSVARNCPDDLFTVVTSAFASRLFINPPENVRLLGLGDRECHGLAGTFRMLRRLRAVKPDAVADLHNVIRSWTVDAYFLLSGRRVAMLDKRRRERRAILKRKKIADRPFSMRYFDVFARLGRCATPAFTSLFPHELPALPADISPKGGEKWVGIAPFARYENKTLSLGQTQRVAKELAGDPSVRVFLFGGKGAESATLRSWEALSPRITSVAGVYTLAEELYLMAWLDVMVSMDSANMHLASLAGTRVLSVWCATAPACGFLGYGQQEADTVTASVPCSPCSVAGSRRCPLGTAACTQADLAEDIVRRVTEILEGQS